MIIAAQILAFDDPKTHGWTCMKWIKCCYSPIVELAKVLARTSSISPLNASCILLARDLMIGPPRMCKGSLDVSLRPWISSLVLANSFKIRIMVT